MEQWQFLIQKQGERVWLPLESPNQEMMEGRYRIVARSHRVNTDVEVRIAHVSASSNPLAMPPVRRIYKRSRRTNHEGLVAVIPFTYFQPGLWEISCSGDLLTDVMGTPWQHAIALKVLTTVTGNIEPRKPLPIDLAREQLGNFVTPSISPDTEISLEHISQQESIPQKNISSLPTPPAPPLNPAKSSLSPIIPSIPSSSSQHSLTGNSGEFNREITESIVLASTDDDSVANISSVNLELDNLELDNLSPENLVPVNIENPAKLVRPTTAPSVNNLKKPHFDGVREQLSVNEVGQTEKMELVEQAEETESSRNLDTINLDTNLELNLDLDSSLDLDFDTVIQDNSISNSPTTSLTTNNLTTEKNIENDEINDNVIDALLSLYEINDTDTDASALDTNVDANQLNENKLNATELDGTELNGIDSDESQLDGTILLDFPHDGIDGKINDETLLSDLEISDLETSEAEITSESLESSAHRNPLVDEPSEHELPRNADEESVNSSLTDSLVNSDNTLDVLSSDEFAVDFKNILPTANDTVMVSHDEINLNEISHDEINRDINSPLPSNVSAKLETTELETFELELSDLELPDLELPDLELSEFNNIEQAISLQSSTTNQKITTNISQQETAEKTETKQVETGEISQHQPKAIADDVDDDLPVAIVLRNDSIVHQPPPQAWVQADSAEDILQSLLDLALPNTEPLLETETTSETPEVSLPLVVNLEAQTYISQWGVPLTITGNVELNSKDGQINSTNTSRFYYQHVSNVEVRVDVRSPQQLEVLATARESVSAEEIVPFPVTISCQIPTDCESKLLLGDIYIYGALDGIGEPILLASQSFTITADISALLAISAAAKPSEPDMLPIVDTPSSSRTASGIGLELFNLVKTTKPGENLKVSPSPTKHSPKSTLPPIIEPEVHLKAKRRAIAFKTGVAVRDVELKRLQPPTTENASTNNVDLSANVGFSTSPGFPFLRKISDQSSQLSELQENIDTIVERSFPDFTNFDDSGLDELGELEAFTANLDSSDLVRLDNSDADANPPVDHTPETLEPESPTPRKLESGEEFTAIEAIGVESKTLSNGDGETNRDSEIEITTPNILDEPISAQTDPAIQSPLELPPLSGMSPLIRKWIASQNQTFDQIYGDMDNWQQENTDNLEPNSDHGQLFAENTSESNLLGETNQNTQNQSKPLSHLGEEVIIDDEDSEYLSNRSFSNESFSIASDKPNPHADRNPQNSNLLNPTTNELNHQIPEYLATPILHLQPGELIAGHSLRVRVELTQNDPQIALKLWMEDCHTRSLLDGPHLLTALLPNNKGGAETIAELKIPFGCLEVRIGAIAVHLTNQQESDRVTTQRSVIPPDLPKLTIDELYGI